MSETAAVQFTEDRIPVDGIEEGVAELVELYGGQVIASRLNERDFTLPLRRGMATSGAVECTISWAAEAGGEATVTLTCNRDVDAPKAQRVLLLLAGVAGAVMFMLWPFFPGEKAYGTLAWLGGVVAIAVYLMTLRKTSGGIAYDFLQRLAARQRAMRAE
ncbi:MAG TPA: hypothetical protein VEK79_08835 [Thermoanaerobaculia bacterium]|nr:hypothetical protein [Thermoanaerobaculia bacterium]